MDQAIINENMKTLLHAQQGELDAVLMYNKLAEVVSDADALVFKQLAAEEGQHASVFHNYTLTVLKPKKMKSILIPFLYKMLSRNRAYHLIANGEYSAGLRAKEESTSYAPE